MKETRMVTTTVTRIMETRTVTSMETSTLVTRTETRMEMVNRVTKIYLVAYVCFFQSFHIRIVLF